MYLCYIDESGTSEQSGNTSHYVLAGVSIPIWHWKDCDHEINLIKEKYSLTNTEIHTAWILRKYWEQNTVKSFASLDYTHRRASIQSIRRAHLLKLQLPGNNKKYKQTKKNFKETEPYIHLTYEERTQFINEISLCISNWGFARLFAECIDKIYFDSSIAHVTIAEQAFEQLVSRFEQYLKLININKSPKSKCLGLLIHDNNETVAKKHTELMSKYLSNGTLWTSIKNIIETPLFVNSNLTSMVQIADVCGYTIRRYLENNEDLRFKLIYKRADTKDGVVVGIRHFTKSDCDCLICKMHKKGKKD
jgi:hypothetical protein